MSDFRQHTRALLKQLLIVKETELAAFLKQHCTADCIWYLSHPLNKLTSHEQIIEELILPLRHALNGIYRRDEIFIGGDNRRDYGGHWTASVCHYVGNFKRPFIGIPACDRLVFLRSGEFYRIDNAMISEARIIIDFLDLMRQSGSFPLPHMLGTEMLFPAPATHDGVLPYNRPHQGEQTLDLIEAMLKDLSRFDPLTFSSPNQTGKHGYWHQQMMWYGPAGIGSNYRWSGFEKDHRIAFLTAFPDRIGGDHYCRIGDGNYAAVSGWPSMTMTHTGDYLGIKATNKTLTLRVMDFYRCSHSKIMENWVLLDYTDLFKQMGHDLITVDYQVSIP